MGVIDGIYDHGRMATTVVKTETRSSHGALLFTTEWTVAYMLDGGFGGPKSERRPAVRLPATEPDFVITQAISPTQSMLYRLSGDLNPIHVDADVAREAGFARPILHGLCTYGFICRAVLRAAAAGDASQLLALRGDFRSPVYAGETLVTRGWLQGSEVLLTAHTAERPSELVLRNGHATLAPR
jgi:acyl dehydratase